MKKGQFLLLKLAEECVEVAQRASKQIQFGKDEIQRDQTESNAARLRNELMDLICVASMLHDVDELPRITVEELAHARLIKKQKLQKYLDLSASLGQLPEIKL